MASNDRKNEVQDQRRDDDFYQRTITYQVCPKHGRRYPEGDSCPLCDAEDRNPKKGDA